MPASVAESSKEMNTSLPVEGARSALLGWYASNRRGFPWRGLEDPYPVLVSEVMLQQTQASRVAERFPRFVRRFPNAAALAAAPPAAVLAEWSGLGYNRRALNLQRACTAIARQGWPNDVAGLEGLPGVGPYTARAIASLAFGIPVGVVDTNVRRWLLRRFAVQDAPATLQSVADTLAAPGSGEAVQAWTHATMEFGATICRPREPRCGACPLSAGCPSRGEPATVPVPRQPPLAGSDRAYRGALLKQLSASAVHRLEERAARRMIGAELEDVRWEAIVAGLERDGLLHRSAGYLRLGAATIRT